MRSLRTATKSSPRSTQLEKACAQQRRPNAAKNKINMTNKLKKNKIKKTQNNMGKSFLFKKVTYHVKWPMSGCYFKHSYFPLANNFLMVLWAISYSFYSLLYHSSSSHCFPSYPKSSPFPLTLFLLGVMYEMEPTWLRSTWYWNPNVTVIWWHFGCNEKISRATEERNTIKMTSEKGKWWEKQETIKLGL